MPIQVGQLKTSPIQVNQPAIGVMQENLTKNLVLDARLPQMAAAPVAAGNVAGAKMPDQPAAAVVAAGAAAMAAFKPEQAVTTPVNVQREEMQGHPELAAVDTAGKQSYVRLRVRASGNNLTVLSAHEVDGPLLTSTTIAGEHAYEVTLDSKAIAAEGIPDLGESRSFPRPGTEAHFITERQSFEFNVRVPRAALPDSALPRLNVTLYKFPDASAKVLQGKIAALPGLQAKAIAQLPALNIKALEPQLNQQILRIFPKVVQ